MRASALLFAPLLATFAAAAGGPEAIPVPAGCLQDIAGAKNITGLQPDPAFKDANQVYQYYIAMDAASDDSYAEQLQLCEEQCNGFGTENPCRGIYFAHNVPLPVTELGIPGTLSVACVMFGAPISQDDFANTTQAGRYTRPKAENLSCA